MNAATALAKTQQTNLDTIEGRTPARFTVAPAGESTANATFEGLTVADGVFSPMTSVSVEVPIDMSPRRAAGLAGPCCRAWLLGGM